MTATEFVQEYPVPAIPMGEAPVEKQLIEVRPGVHAEVIFFNRPEKRVVCFSTQLSCAVGCAFCASPGLERTTNLTANEMLAQVMTMMDRYSPPRATNPVLFSIMGEGEPLLNYKHVMTAAHSLVDYYGRRQGENVRLSLSTSGVAPDKIRVLAHERFGVPFKLQVSIHSVVPEVRRWLIPLAKPIGDIRDAIHYYREHNDGPVELNFTLMEGVNDSTEHARGIADLFRDQYIKISRFNPIDRNPLLVASQRYNEFVQELHDFGCTKVEFHATDGYRRGAACGQTRGRHIV